MSDFTHFNEQGRAKMVDVGEKPISQRVAVAAGRVLVNEKTFSLIQSMFYLALLRDFSLRWEIFRQVC